MGDVREDGWKVTVTFGSRILEQPIPLVGDRNNIMYTAKSARDCDGSDNSSHFLQRFLE